MDLEKKKLQFKKNDEIVITIEDLGKDGEGIGHVDGYALFVKGALPGEKVLVQCQTALQKSAMVHFNPAHRCKVLRSQIALQKFQTGRF